MRPARPHRDGLLWGYQLWVNLPTHLKLSAPRYQDIPADRIPEVSGGGAHVRVLSGTHAGVQGAAQSITGVLYLDVALDAGAFFERPVAVDDAVLAYVISGNLEGRGPGGDAIRIPAGRLAIFGPGEHLALRAAGEPLRLLLLAAAPLDEPVVRMGPFVMNTREKLMQAVEDYRGGRLGR